MTITTTIGYGEKDRIVVRDRDLARDIIGKLDFVDMMMLLILGRVPEAGEKRMLNALLVTTADHGLTPITLAARLTLLGAPEALQGAVAAGLLGGGDRFLGTIGTVCAMLSKGRDELGASSNDDALRTKAREIVDAYRAQSRHVPGFGHPIHVDGDPRIPALVEVSKECGYYGAAWKLILAIEKEIAARGRRLPLNGAGGMGAMCAELGLDPVLGRGLALVGRCAGVVAHLFEESKTPIAQEVWDRVLEEDRHRRQ